MLDHGGVRTWVSIDSYSDEWDSQASITGSRELTVTPVESSRRTGVLEFEFMNNELIFIDRDNSFDFTLSDTTEVPATSVTTFVKH
jgi:hypothetical protein